MSPVLRPTALTALLLLGATALAQTPAVPRPGVPANPQTIQPAEPIASIKGLEFPNSDAKEVLSYYEQLTGKQLVYDTAIVVNMSLVVRQEMSRDEAVRLIEMSLLMNGITLVPAGGNVVKVLGPTKNPRGFGIPIYSDEMLLPEGEQVVSFILRLEDGDPTKIASTLLTFIQGAGNASTYTQVLPLPESQSLLITESTPNIRNLVQIARGLDIPAAPVVSEFIKLERADAKTIIEKLQEIFEKNQPTTGAPVADGSAARIVRPVNVNITPEGTPLPPGATVAETGANSIEISAGTLSEDGIIVGKIKLAADERTNRIHVITRPRNMEFIRELLREFDKDVPFGEPMRRVLQHRQANELFPVIKMALTDPGVKIEEGASVGGGTGQGARNRPTMGGGGSSRSTNDPFSNSNSDVFGGGSSSGLGGSGSGGIGKLASMERETAPEAVMIGSTKLIADNATNSIITIGNREIQSKVDKIIDELDVRQPQVKLHTVVGEITLGANETLSVDYILRNGAARIAVPTSPGTGNGNGGNGNGNGNGNGTGNTGGGLVSLNGTTPLLNFQNLINQQTVTSIGTAGAGGLSGFFTAGNTLDVIVRALESTDRFRVTSRPNVMTTNNRAASIVSGQQIAVPTNIQSSFNTGNNLVSNSSVQYRRVALELEILPLINSKGDVSLDILQSVEEISGSTRIDNNDIPTISERTLNTHVTVPDQATLVLGGLIRQSETNNRSGIPYLSRIPVVGALFRSTTKAKQRTELVILIRPEVILNDSDAVEQREREFEMMELEPDLESSLARPNVRKRAPFDELLRRSQMTLRQESETVQKVTTTQGTAK